MWQVLIHPLVFKDDFKRIPATDQKIIIKAIRKKLSQDPQNFGKPLTADLKGYWRLRVGEYRVIYSIIRDQITVKVIKIGIRRDSEVYEGLLRRLPKTAGF